MRDWVEGLSEKRLELIIFTTEKCNFRCPYCYEDFKVGNISNRTIKGIKNLISRKLPTLSKVNLSYFGGEPLLNLAAIEEITSWATKQALQWDATVSGHITTNGYFLTHATIEKLRYLSISSFQVTLDGAKSSHNELRPLANGGETYDVILANVKRLIEIYPGCQLNVRINVSDRNLDSIDQLICYDLLFLLESKASFISLHEVFSSNDRENSSLMADKAAVRGAIAHFYKLAKNLGYNTDAKDDAEGSDYVCYAAKANSWVIRSNGRVQKCTVDLYSEKNSIGSLLENGEIRVDEEKLRRWIFAESKACPLSTL